MFIADAQLKRQVPVSSATIHGFKQLPNGAVELHADGDEMRASFILLFWVVKPFAIHAKGSFITFFFITSSFAMPFLARPPFLVKTPFIVRPPFIVRLPFIVSCHFGFGFVKQLQ